MTLVLVKNDYRLLRCSACALLHVNPMPSADALQAHYQNPAYFQGEEDQGYRNYEDMRKALRPHFERRLRLVERRRPARGRLLDFGCADGYFLEIAQTRGWEIAGVELSRTMAQQASRTLQIPIPPSLEGVDQQFDVITAWEVVEYLPDPVEQLRQFLAHLRPGGLLMLSTPNNNHWQAEREPDAWIAYRPPSHLIYFTPPTLINAFQRAGFVDIRIQRVMPLPPLPAWLRQATVPLQRGLANGQARAWTLSLLAWRAVRVLGWGWQKITRPDDDIFTTLEALAARPE